MRIQWRIGGNWSGDPAISALEVRDPASDELITRVPSAGPAEASAAVEAAAAAMPGWSATDRDARARLLHSVAEAMTARIEGRAPMPFIADTADAADRFGRAIVRGSRRIAYPRVHAWSSAAIALVPRPLFEPMAQRASEPQRQLYELERGKR